MKMMSAMPKIVTRNLETKETKQQQQMLKTLVISFVFLKDLICKISRIELYQDALPVQSSLLMLGKQININQMQWHNIAILATLQ